MENELSRNIDIAKDKAQYDQLCKMILANKTVLEWIMRRTVREYAGMTIEAIRDCIEGEPEIASRRVNPGETNAGNYSSKKSKKEQIQGLPEENQVNGEGKIYYDIRYTAIIPGKKEKIRLIINVEAQKAFYVGYFLTTRGIFYAARMISAQLETEFSIPEYDDIKKVYSIWLCFNASKHIGNAISEYSIKKQDFLPGIPDHPEEYDKLSVVMVCLNREEKLETEYQIPMENELGKGLNLMCNLSDVIEEKGIERGIEKGRLETLISLVRDGLLSTKDAAERLNLSEEQFRKMMKDE